MSRTSRAYSKRARERSRVAAHIARAEKLARENAPSLDPLRALVRELLLQALREYREEGLFPENHHTDCYTPVFVDEKGTHCAVGHLLAISGQSQLVRKISSERNLATVHQLSDEPALAQWLDAAGISLAEAELIQPSYGPACSTLEQCFCYAFAPVPATDGGAPQQATAVLECTVLSPTSARVDVIHGSTTGHAVGSTIELPQYQRTRAGDATRILVPVLSDGTQPRSWTINLGTQGVVAIGLQADGTATCEVTALDSPPVTLRARSQNVINALLSDNCASSLAASEPRSNERMCNPGCACAVPASAQPTAAPATLSILLSLVTAMVVRRARARSHKSRASAQRAPSSSIE